MMNRQGKSTSFPSRLRETVIKKVDKNKKETTSRRSQSYIDERRRELIYILNDYLREVENQNFENFMKQMIENNNLESKDDDCSYGSSDSSGSLNINWDMLNIDDKKASNRFQTYTVSTNNIKKINNTKLNSSTKQKLSFGGV
jgi:hypothetical protein